MTPYQYAGNNPIVNIDINGDSIYIVNQTEESQAAIETLQRTEAGKELWEKYENSSDHDIYIGVQSYGEEGAHANGATAAEVENTTAVKDGKISVPDDSPISTSMSSMDGVDVSKSDGKKISLVTLNSDNATQRDQYNNAETIFHEIKAHVDMNVGGLDADHEAYGIRKFNYKGETAVYNKSGSPSDIINKQLRTLKKKDNE